MKEYDIKINFIVRGVRDINKEIGTLLDNLAKAKTNLVWDDVDWYIEESYDLQEHIDEYVQEHIDRDHDYMFAEATEQGTHDMCLQCDCVRLEGSGKWEVIA